MRSLLVLCSVLGALMGAACSGTDKVIVSTATPAASPSVAATDTPKATVQPTAVPTATVLPSPTKNPRPKVGDTTEAKGSKYIVNEVRDPVVPTNQFSKPAAGMRWLAIDVTQEGTAPGGDDYNPFYFSIQDDKAFVYQRGGLGGPEPRLSSGKLAAGQKVRGWVTFEIPADAKVISIMTQPEAIGGTIVIADLTK